MSLRPVVQALGGDLYQNGARANVPAPGHSPADRSVSLMVSGDRLVVHSFGAADWREVLDDLRRRGLIDRDGRLQGKGAGPTMRRSTPAQRVQAAIRLWEGGRRTGTSGHLARHLARRGVAWSPELLDLREHPAAPLSVYREGRATRRAMMARITGPDGDLVGVELTYLDPNGDQAVGLRLSRKTIGGVPPGAAVRLCRPAPRMVVAEGAITTLSAMALLDRPGWALLSAGNLAQWTPPSGVQDVLIAADRGEAGERAAQRLQRRLAAAGAVADIAWPPQGHGDWNEAHLRLGRAPSTPR